MGVAIVLGEAAHAQSELSAVVVTGTRRADVSATESLSPIDIVGGAAVSEQAAFDLTDSMTRISPSINTQRFPIADGTSFIRPVSLRNLSPDHTLVLVNGARRHRSALVNLQLAPLGTVNQGAQGVDWSTFPAAAIERVEILRDGASAQYGSDAIAGVINVILKDASEGGALSAQYGQYAESDGERLSVNGNIGLPLGSDGFVNISGEYSTSDETSRGAARPDAEAVGAIVGANLVPEEGLGQRWGDPNVDQLKFFVNAGITVGNGVEIYGNANYMEAEVVSDFFYRRPVLPNPADQIALSARTTLQIDSVINASGLPGSDGLPDNATVAQVNAITAAGGNPADYLTASAASPSGWVLRNPIHTLFPGGYNPDFGADLTDMGILVGVRGELTDTLSWDARVRYGEHEADYTLSSSINPSLGRLSPTSFRPGTLTQEESGFNLDFVKTFANSPLNLAFGGELRNETYEIGAGDLASIQAGPTAAIFGVGSDGFQGFPVESAGSFESDSWAAYVDLESDLTDALSGAVAVRYEDYDEFGNTTDGKLSLRYAFTDDFAVRATASTGFRAPTPGQVNTLNVTTTSDQFGNLIPNGTYPVSHPIAIALGAVPLVPEDSQSYTAGLVWAASDTTSVTLDFYHIEIDDRLALLTNTIGPAEVALLIAAGIPPAEANLLLGSNANFFVNGFDSEIEGFDLAISSSVPVGGGELGVDIRYNYNEQGVSNVAPGTINASRVYDLKNQTPVDRALLTFDYSTGGMFSGLVRLAYYGSWSTTAGLFSPGDASDKYRYGDNYIVDLEARFKFGDRYTLTIGGENVFDIFPGAEQDPTSQFLGVRPALTSPFGINGGFWYARASVTF
ncbi:MAG: TonB-dependent receptor plug domain-containing protein [Gammaproteobacteria bacterium]